MIRSYLGSLIHITKHFLKRVTHHIHHKNNMLEIEKSTESIMLNLLKTVVKSTISIIFV